MKTDKMPGFKKIKAISPIKTSEQSIYIGALHVNRVKEIAVWLTRELKRPVSTQEAARYVIDKFSFGKNDFNRS